MKTQKQIKKEFSRLVEESTSLSSQYIELYEKKWDSNHVQYGGEQFKSMSKEMDAINEKRGVVIGKLAVINWILSDK